MSADLLGSRFQLHRELARTPLLVVHEAVDQRFGTPAGVAVARHPGALHGLGRQLLGRGAVTASHPNLLDVYDRGSDARRPFVAFRLPAGTLAAELSVAPLPSPHASRLGGQLASALAALHRARVRLGGFHPGHVGIDDGGDVRLSPWPLAAAPEGWGGDGAWSPPERVAGSPPTAAADLWSLGAVLLSSLVGAGPGHLSGVDAEELSTRLRRSAAPDLLATIGRSMETDPARRFTSAGAMAAALAGDRAAGATLATAGHRHRRVVVAFAGVVAVVAAASAGVGLTTLGVGHGGRPAEVALAATARPAPPDTRRPTAPAVPAPAVIPAPAPTSTVATTVPAPPPVAPVPTTTAPPPVATPTAPPVATPTAPPAVAPPVAAPSPSAGGQGGGPIAASRPGPGAGGGWGEGGGRGQQPGWGGPGR